MANLLNAIPQASNKAAPSIEAPSARNTGKNPAKLEGKELKEIFDKKLSESLSEAADDQSAETVTDATKDLAAVALAAGAVNGPKVAPIDLKKAGTDAHAGKVDPKAAKAAAVVDAKGTPIQNQLQVAGKNVKLDPKAAQVSATQMAAAKNAELLAKGINQPATAELATAMAGTDLLKLPGEFDVESVDLKNSDVKAALPKEASSKLSTADFLNLREISQNPAKPNLALATPALTDASKLAPIPATTAVVMGMKPTQKQKGADGKDLSAAMAGLTPAHDKQTFGKTMDATVTQTAGQKAVLSKESVTQIGNQVNLLGQARQDGEIKIRLRPDHLGELQMSVRTQGQAVSIQIKAANDGAKKIIEDSLGALREHLAGQNLSLARIDVVTQPSGNSTMDQTQMNLDANQNFNQSSANADRQNSQEGGQSRRDLFGDDRNLGGAQAPTMIRPRTVDSTRLDLIA